ncbi:MAG: hypothetical protein R3E66_20070 [bacterium]
MFGSRRSVVLVFCIALLSGCGGDGRDGAPGTSGEAGQNSWLRTTPIEAGDTCAAGGSLIEFGLDANDDGTLDDDEVSGQTTVCAGVTGAEGTSGGTSLIRITPEAAGATCPAGGQIIEAGIDDNNDGTLEDTEVDASTSICNGLDGQDGAASLLNITAEGAGANCAEGGQKIESGVDDSHDGTLDSGEVDQTAYLCNGADGLTGASGDPGPDGLTTLLTLVAEPAGANCSAGGQLISSGLDDNGDGVLDSTEVDSSAYVCNAASCALSTIALTATDHVSFSSTGAAFNDNRLRAYTSSAVEDLVSWIRFVVPPQLNGGIVQSVNLTMTHEDGFGNPINNPVMELMLSNYDGWNSATVTTAQLTADAVISGPLTNFPTTQTPVDFPLNVGTANWDAELNTSDITIGMRETTAQYRFVYFLGSDVPATAPVLTINYLKCP